MAKLSTPRSVRTQDTKDKIYKAATSILKKKGYAYLSVSNICAEAGVSNGTFFYHFKTKEELLTYYTYDQFARYRTAHNFEQAVEGLPFDGKILTFYCYWCDYVEDTGIDFFSNFYSTKNVALDVRRWNQREPANIWAFPGTCLKEAQSVGHLSASRSVEHYAESLAVIIKGICFDWCISDGSSDMKRMCHELMGPYLNSIKI